MPINCIRSNRGRWDRMRRDRKVSERDAVLKPPTLSDEYTIYCGSFIVDGIGLPCHDLTGILANLIKDSCHCPCSDNRCPIVDFLALSKLTSSRKPLKILPTTPPQRSNRLLLNTTKYFALSTYWMDGS